MRKYIITILIVSSVLALSKIDQSKRDPTPIAPTGVTENVRTEKSLFQTCKDVAAKAKDIMLDRQTGKPMSEMIEKIENTLVNETLVNRRMQQALIIDAYKIPQWDTSEMRQASSVAFRDSMYSVCIQAAAVGWQ